jgi:hypothetical protein
MSDATRRQTRSQTRREHRALLEQALAVCMTGGYLYRYECMKVACLSHGCHDLYQECKDNVPAGAEVSIRVMEQYASVWASDQTKALFTSPAVLRTIFDKINRLRVQSQTTPETRAAAKAAMPLWGVDAQVAVILGFRVTESPTVLVHFTRSQFPEQEEVPQHRPVWRCTFLLDFTLVNALFPQYHLVEDYYDGEPLWP